MQWSVGSWARLVKLGVVECIMMTVEVQGVSANLRIKEISPGRPKDKQRGDVGWEVVK